MGNRPIPVRAIQAPATQARAIPVVAIQVVGIPVVAIRVVGIRVSGRPIRTPGLVTVTPIPVPVLAHLTRAQVVRARIQVPDGKR